MREILFRGKRKDNGEWIENHTVVELRYGQKYIPNNSAPSGLKIDENGNRVSFVALFHEVIPETVGQFTGMFDGTKWEQLTEEEQLDWLKNHTIDEWNGRMIFEGDIIDCWSEGINAQGAVQQRIDGLWIIYPAWQNQQFWGLCPNRNGSTSVKIIGNIHDNPELLKGGAE